LLAKAIAEQISSQTPARLGAEPLGIGSLGDTQVYLLDSTIRQLRRSKDPDEIMLIRRSVAAGEAAHATAMRELGPGMTEIDAFLLVQAAAFRALEQQVLVYGDFVSGPRCELERGGMPGRRVICSGDLLMLDFSVVVHGYRADFTNTFVVDGVPTARQSELYEHCMNALDAGESLLRARIEASAVDAAVRGQFQSVGMAAYFPSHTGHGLGLGHPEPPYIVPESSDTLQIGDVVALEPGLYVPGTGGMRFERNYLITESGFELLTRHRLTLTP
jgi:Xaa-Pro aminopeptidase